MFRNYFPPNSAGASIFTALQLLLLIFHLHLQAAKSITVSALTPEGLVSLAIVFGLRVLTTSLMVQHRLLAALLFSTFLLKAPPYRLTAVLALTARLVFAAQTSCARFHLFHHVLAVLFQL
jgi:hypothetical protein